MHFTVNDFYRISTWLKESILKVGDEIKHVFKLIQNEKETFLVEYVYTIQYTYTLQCNDYSIQI